VWFLVCLLAMLISETKKEEEMEKEKEKWVQSGKDVHG